MEPVVVVELISVKWMLGFIVGTGGGGIITVIWLLRLMRNEHTIAHNDIIKLLKMHQDADKYGFGTGATNEMIQSIERTQKALIHYIRWGVEKMTGEKPPPFVDGE